jgi:hypothetical protein
MPKNRSTAITLFGKSIVMMLPLMLISACSGQGRAALTRPKAKELIAIKFGADIGPILRFPFDHKMWNESNVSSVNQWTSAYNNGNGFPLIKLRQQLTNVFKDMGLVEYHPVTDKDVYLQRYYFTEAAERAMVLEISKVSFPLGIARLTQDGIAETSIGNWRCQENKMGTSNGGPFVESTWCDIPLARDSNIVVTGITQNGPTAIADYTRSYIPSRIGQRMLQEIASFPSLESLGRLRSGDRGQATFRLYDDGWRIVR